MKLDVIHNENCLTGLRKLPDACVQTCITSPPYFNLRDYGVPGQIGLEATPEAYVARLVEVFREVRRVLKNDGTVWLNLGDSYAANGGGGESRMIEMYGKNSSACKGIHSAAGHGQKSGSKGCTYPGFKPKDLIGIPWRVAFALQADGWWLRSDIIWAKGNPMPESIRDRPTKAHEYLFLLAKSQKYFYDADAVKESCSDNSHGSPRANMGLKQVTTGNNQGGYLGRWTAEDKACGRNKRSVWTITTKPFKEAHFAVMPEALVEPCVLAGSKPGDTVLDPFAGAGTVAVVAQRHGRNYLGYELNSKYVKIAQKRISASRAQLALAAA